MFETDNLIDNSESKETFEYATSLEVNQFASEPNHLPQETLKYVVTNFNHICRFCLSKSSSNLQMIFDDSEIANYDLIEKINFTLYDQVSTK